MRIWRNWQTRMVQVHVKAISCRFKSCYPHHVAASGLSLAATFLQKSPVRSFCCGSFSEKGHAKSLGSLVNALAVALLATNLFRFVRFAHLKTLDFTVFFLKFCNTIRRIFLSKYGFTLPNAAPFSQKSSFASAMSLQAQNITSTLHYHFFAIFCALRT